VRVRSVYDDRDLRVSTTMVSCEGSLTPEDSWRCRYHVERLWGNLPHAVIYETKQGKIRWKNFKAAARRINLGRRVEKRRGLGRTFVHSYVRGIDFPIDAGLLHYNTHIYAVSAREALDSVGYRDRHSEYNSDSPPSYLASDVLSVIDNDADYSERNEVPNVSWEPPYELPSTVAPPYVAPAQDLIEDDELCFYPYKNNTREGWNPDDW